MRYIFQIVFVLCAVFSTSAQNDTRTGEVHLNDSTNIYYFDLFNDKRSFHWDTISKIFNFDNYRVYFKNNSNDTLLAGGVKTGDGRVSYHYASHHKLILPGEYFILRAFHNGSIKYRHGRFSKSVLMTAFCKDSIYNFSHRYVGWYSEDSSSGFVPRIKLDESLNTSPTQEERQYLQKRYTERMKNSKARKAARRKQLQQELLPQVEVEEERKIVPEKPQVIQKELHLYLTYRRQKLDSSEQVFAESVNGDRLLNRVEKSGYNPYYLLVNPDSLDVVFIYTKNAEGHKKLYQKVETTFWRDVRMDFDGSWTYFSKMDSSAVFTREYLKLIQPKKVEKSSFSISIRSTKIITQECEMEALENGNWVQIPLKPDEYNNYYFTYRTSINTFRRRVRWKIRSNEQWNLDWVYLYRTNSQTITVDSLVNFISNYGTFHLDVSPGQYRIRIVDDFINRSLEKVVRDSIREIFRWYGIPLVSASFEELHLKDDKDNIRAQRALNRHFEKAILLPIYDGSNEADWFCPSVRLVFLKNVTKNQIKKLLIQHGFRDFNIGKEVDKITGFRTVMLTIDSLISPKFLVNIKKLYQRQELYTMLISKCGITAADTPW